MPGSRVARSAPWQEVRISFQSVKLKPEMAVLPSRLPAGPSRRPALRMVAGFSRRFQPQLRDRAGLFRLPIPSLRRICHAKGVCNVPASIERIDLRCRRCRMRRYRHGKPWKRARLSGRVSPRIRPVARHPPLSSDPDLWIQGSLGQLRLTVPSLCRSVRADGQKGRQTMEISRQQRLSRADLIGFYLGLQGVLGPCGRSLRRPGRRHGSSPTLVAVAAGGASA